jgi:uncharacterized protein YkwD
MRLIHPTLGRSVPAIALAGALFLGASGFPGVSPSGAGVALAATCNVSDLSLSTQEQAFVGLLNTYRGQSSAQPVIVSAPLEQAATWMAGAMAATGVVSHTDSLGRGFVSRLSDCGVVSRSMAENVAAGFTTAQAVFDAWRNSSSHNANMLNPTFNQLGVAEVNGFWVTDFAAGSGAQVTPATPPAPVTSTSIQAPPVTAGGGTATTAPATPPTRTSVAQPPVTTTAVTPQPATTVTAPPSSSSPLPVLTPAAPPAPIGGGIAVPLIPTRPSSLQAPAGAGAGPGSAGMRLRATLTTDAPSPAIMGPSGMVKRAGPGGG